MHRKPELENIYRRLLEEIANKYIGIQTLPRMRKGEIAKFIPRPPGTKKNIIQLLRTGQNQRHINCNSQEPNQIQEEDKSFLICTVNRPIAKEIVVLAHEIGHSFSSDNTIDDIYNELDKTNHFKSCLEKYRVLKEEKLAWRHAQSILIRLGFRSKRYFERVRSRSLRSYQRIPIKSSHT